MEESFWQDFDPSGPGLANGHLYGLPHSPAQARLVLIPVPWDATVSYAAGTHRGPQAILDASLQVDLYDPILPEGWKAGIAMADMPAHLLDLNKAARQQARQVIAGLEKGLDVASFEEACKQVNDSCAEMTAWVKAQAVYWLDQGKIVGVLGGDHSTPLGLMQALAERSPQFGILQIDAHLDLREAYEGFGASHASIMYNALRLPQVSKLVSVGIRDYCEEEHAFVQRHSQRVAVFPYRDLAQQQFHGMSWAEQVQLIVDSLPQQVYVSFDIDGLNPTLCPHTGTPVPGGLEFEQSMYLIGQVRASGRQIIGVDLCEVAPGPDGNEWDANVGARVLYRLFLETIKANPS
ncbi:MAG: agmatinase [Bacteroidetes bacterium]|nr:MAG: agmatinase [Bacteroidota bacterium]